jgi:hypothetical protein
MATMNNNRNAQDRKPHTGMGYLKKQQGSW